MALIAHWKLDEPSGTTALDELGTSNGTLVNSPTRISGRDGNALSFSGTSHVVINRSATLEPAEVSFALWIRPNGTQQYAYNSIFGKMWGNDTSPSYVSWCLQFPNVAGTNLSFVVGTPTSASHLLASSAIPNDGSTWSHIVCTYSPGTATRRLYINGNLSSSDSLSSAIVYDTTSTGNVYIAHNGATKHYTGAIDDVRLYSHALTQTEVTNLYNSYFATQVNLTGTAISTNINGLEIEIPDNVANLGGNASAISVGALDAVDNTTPAPVARTVNIAAEARVIFVYPPLDGSFPPYTDSEVYAYGLNELSSNVGKLSFTIAGLVGHWKFDNDVLDSSEYGNHGTPYNNPTYGSGILDQAINFNAASSQYVIVDRDPVFESQAISISVWVKASGVTQQVFTAIVKKSYNNNATPPRGSWGIQFDGTSGTNLFFLTGHTAGLNSNDLDFINPIPNDGNTWVHIVATYDPNATPGSDNKIVYVNSVVDVSTELHDAILYDTTSTGNLYIGQSGDSNDAYNGAIDDLRVYNYALNQSQVTALYTSYLSATVDLSSQALSAAVNPLSVETPNSVDYDLSGQSITSSINNVVVTGNADLTLTSHELTSELNALDVQGDSLLTLSDLQKSITVDSLVVQGYADLELDPRSLFAPLGIVEISGNTYVFIGSSALSDSLNPVEVVGNASILLGSHALSAALSLPGIIGDANIDLDSQAPSISLGVIELAGEVQLFLDSHSLSVSLNPLGLTTGANLDLVSQTLSSAINALSAVESRSLQLDSQVLSAALATLSAIESQSLDQASQLIIIEPGNIEVTSGEASADLFGRSLKATLGSFDLIFGDIVNLGSQSFSASLGSLIATGESQIVPAPSGRTIAIAALDRRIIISVENKMVTIVDQGRIINIQAA